jgi:hypothetical protein
MSRTPLAAVAVASAESVRPTRDWAGWCLMFVRICLGIAKHYNDAADAWAGAKAKHTTGVPPVGVPVFWAIGAHGHVALSAGGGYVWSTDIRRRGRVDRVPISEVTSRWGARYLGWTGDLNGAAVSYSLPAPKVASLSMLQTAARHPDGKGWKPGTQTMVHAVMDELRALKCYDGYDFRKTFRKFQLLIGDSGEYADGIPGARQLAEFGRRRRWKIVP